MAGKGKNAVHARTEENEDNFGNITLPGIVNMTLKQ